MNYRATPLEALASAVALPDVFTEAEMLRTLRRNNGDIMRSASQLKDKHAFRNKMHLPELNVGLLPLQEELRKGYAHLLDGAEDSEHCPVLLLQLQHFKPGFGQDQKLQRQGCGAVDGSVDSSLEDARRLCVYLMDLAVELMEESNAPGIVFIVDVGNCTLANLEAKMVTDILQMCKNWYPEVVKRILVINGSAFTRVLSIILSKLLGVRTQQRVRVLSDLRELGTILPSTAIPQYYGGNYAMIHPNTWIKKQAELEVVDLDAALKHHNEDEEQERGYGVEERDIDLSESLNGMQYANVSALDASEMPNSVLRGPLMRKKMDAVWIKYFAVLRPEALLLYEHATSNRPLIIIPVNYEVQVMAATFYNTPKSCGFRMDVPGCVGGHELVAMSEQERGNWLQELQWAIKCHKEKVERREEREERRAKIHRDFEALDMINFDVDLPVAPSSRVESSNLAALMSGDGIETSKRMGMTHFDDMQQPSTQSQTPVSGVALLDFGLYQQSPSRSDMAQQRAILMQQPTMFGMQSSASVQQQPTMLMNMQPPIPRMMHQPMMRGMQGQQLMQMDMNMQYQSMEQQLSMAKHQGMNLPVPTGCQFELKSLQDQLLSNFRG